MVVIFGKQRSSMAYRTEGERTQQEIADMIEIYRASYANYETGSRTPTVPTAKKIGSLLGFDWTRFCENKCVTSTNSTEDKECLA